MPAHAILRSMLRQITQALRDSPDFQESFSNEIVRPLVQQTFGTSLRNVAYIVIGVISCIVAMILLLCVLMVLTYVRVAKIMQTILCANS